MTKLKKTVLFAIITLMLTACFDVKEKVAMNVDGSGQYTFEINLGKLKRVFQMSEHFQEAFHDTTHQHMHTTTPENPLEKILFSFTQLQSEMDDIDGVSDYEVVWDSVGYMVGVTFSFADITALNAGVNKIQSDDQSDSRTLFRYDGNVFERISTQDVVESSQELSEDSSQTELYRNSYFSTEYSFSKPISEYTNDAYYLSRDKKTVIAEFALYDIATGNEEVGTTIDFEND